MRGKGEFRLTSDTTEELTSKCLDVRAGEGRKAVVFQKVKHALTVEIGNDANVVSVVEALA